VSVRRARSTSAIVVLASALVASHAHAQRDATLEVRTHGEWRQWWSAAKTPTRWAAPLAALDSAITWRRGMNGVEFGELELSAPREAWRTKAVVVRVDPRKVRFTLEAAIGDGGTSSKWTIDRADSSAILAVNVGQFEDASPWGWVVHGGREARPPRAGPLSSAVVFEAGGGVTLVDARDIAAMRGSAVAYEAFQSYPTLLTGDGDVPQPLITGAGIDIAHRDGRLAIGELRDGKLLFVLTRFDALGGVASSAPIGLTVPEMSALMGALGCRRAVSLDGGLSSQLMVRTTGGAQKWSGWRKVPMGLIAIPR
jgi:hypothetical protein